MKLKTVKNFLAGIPFRTWCILLCALVILVGVYGVYRPLPYGVAMYGETFQLADSAVTFLADETFLDENGNRVTEQEIFDEVFRMIDSAQEYILVDMFLWNAFQGSKPETHRLLSEELTQALIKKKKENPYIRILLISDPINTVYGGQTSPEFDTLAEAGIPVTLTNLSMLRDSNPLYSVFWRTVLQWPDNLHGVLFGTTYTFRLFPNVMDADGEEVTLRAYLGLLNFKANHRKLIVTDGRRDDRKTMVSLISSANPHNGSSAHGNVALRVEGGIWRDVLVTERAVAEGAGATLPFPEEYEEYVDEQGPVSVALRTEEAIYYQVLDMLKRAGEGAEVQLAMFYLSEADIVDALISASKRGATVRVILDPNKDAFGLEKNGVPNRPVAEILSRGSDGAITIRWCDTHGEQCHSKLLLVSTGTSYEMLLGSANYTRRNVENYNLETNVWVASAEPSTAYSDARAYFERMWNNKNGRTYTVPFEVYRDKSWVTQAQYHIMEFTGLSTF